METIKDFVKTVSEELQSDYKEKYVELGRGRNRLTYDMGDGWVVKIPLHMYGMEDNLTESKIYNETKDNPENYCVQYAECMIFTYKDIPLLIMEKVEPITHYYDFPDWADYVDCQQVGYTKDGKVVAYDYGRF